MMYDVRDRDTFQIGLYPEVQKELEIISGHFKQLPGDHKVEIVISFLKDHCITSAWFNENSEAIGLITSRFFDTEHTEALFMGCKTNEVFRKDFEKCIAALLS